MKSIVLLGSFFGKLPAHFDLWLNSCKYNSTINWIIITDDRTEYHYPSNVRAYYITFLEFIQKVEGKLGFSINVKQAYKLCDFKPMYGYIMGETIEGFDYWGHCDIIDTLYGDIRSFLNDELLQSADKLMFLGHLTIYRNTDEVNKRYLLSDQLGKPIEEILNDPDNQQFDEFSPYGINAIYNKYNFPMKRVDKMYCDISPIRFAFQESVYDERYNHRYIKKRPSVIFWSIGKLYLISLNDDNKIDKRELGYVHFQKRKVDCKLPYDSNSFFLIPNKFIDTNDLNFESLDDEMLKEFIRISSRDKLIYIPFFVAKRKALNYHIKRFMHSLSKLEKQRHCK